jgi:hypothetical protein
MRPVPFTITSARHHTDDALVDAYLESQPSLPHYRAAPSWLWAALLLTLITIAVATFTMRTPTQGAAYHIPWNSVFPAPVHAVYVGDALACDAGTVGVIRYRKGGDLQLCQGGQWLPISPVF